MDPKKCLIGPSKDLRECEKGIRFDILFQDGTMVQGFVVRFNGKVFGYKNRCTHVGINLDWGNGKFFNSNKKFLICSTHGALYNPVDGACHAGPCNGNGLTKLNIVENEDNIYVLCDGEILNVG